MLYRDETSAFRDGLHVRVEGATLFYFRQFRSQWLPVAPILSVSVTLSRAASYGVFLRVRCVPQSPRPTCCMLRCSSSRLSWSPCFSANFARPSCRLQARRRSWTSSCPTSRWRRRCCSAPSRCTSPSCPPTG